MSMVRITNTLLAASVVAILASPAGCLAAGDRQATNIPPSAGVIPKINLIQNWSSTGGTSEHKKNDKDLIYKVEQGDKLNFSVSATGTQAYKWKVMKGSKVLTTSTKGNAFAWTVPPEKSTWEIYVEAANPNGRDYLSWSVTTSDLKTVKPGESIQEAIDSLPPDGGIVELAAGTWAIEATLKIAKSNVTLRGAGKDKTVIKGSRSMLLLLVRGPKATNPRPWGPHKPYPKPPDPVFIEEITIKDLALTGAKVDKWPAGYGSHGGISVHEGWKVKVSDVRVERTGGSSIHGGYSYNVNVINNTCRDSFSGICFWRSHKCTVANNTVHKGRRFGIELNTGNRDFIIENNTVSGFTTLAGLYLYGANNCIYRNNLLHSNKYGADISPGANYNIIENNVFRNNGKYGIWIRGQYYSGGHTIRKNLIYSNGKGGIVTVFSGANLKKPKTMFIESNIIVSNGGDAIFNDVPKYTFIVKNNIIVNNAGFGIRKTAGKVTSSYNDVWNNTAGRYSGISAGTGDINVNPEFADQGSGDFRLKSKAGRWNPKSRKWVKDEVQSPCIDAGDPKSEYKNELKPNGGRINLGAYGNTGKASISAVAKSSGPAPNPTTLPAKTGYKPMPKGANYVRVWDLGKKYTYKHYWPTKQWKDRANWIQVPYGKAADYKFRGDCMLEGPNFWMSLHASGHDACFLYNKTDAEGTPSRHNEMYRSYDQPGGLRTYCGSYEYNKIIKNERGDIIVESRTKIRRRRNVDVYLINRYRVQAGKPWLEVEPMNKMVSEQGMHGESRIHLSPESLPDGQDFLADSWKNDPPKSIYHPHTSRMLLDLIMDDDCIWAMMWKTTGKMPSKDKRPYYLHRSRSNNCRGGYPAGWQRIGEGSSPLIFTSPFVKYRKEKMVIGILRIGHWHYQKIGATVQAGKDYKGRFKYAYQRKVKSSPFSTGKRWWPMYPGKWRMIGCIDGKYYTQKITVTKADVGKSGFTFRSPLAGTLEYVVFYLYDRTDQTPKDIFTLMDIYRQSIGDDKAKETWQMSTLKAGAARANITPPVGAITNNGKPAIGVASELFAKALVLDDGRTKAALVTVDVILLGKQVVAETRERIEEMTGIPGSHVMFAASHTHSTPMSFTREPLFVTGGHPPDQSYVDQLIAKMAGAAAEANSNLAEVRLGAGEGQAPFNVARWIPTPDGPTGARWAPNPETPTDETLSVLRVDRMDGSPLAAVVNYAAHASVSGWGKYFSADYPGFLQGILEKTYDGTITAMFVNGASGDLKINWLGKKEDGSPRFLHGGVDDARRWGWVVGGVALSVLEQIETTEQDCRISISSRQVDFPMLPLPSVEEVEKKLAAKRKAGEDTRWEERVLPTLRDGTAPTAIAGEVQLLRLGNDIALLAVPGEMFTEIGLRMRSELDCKNLFIVGYANGAVGYLPSASSCREDGMKPRYDWHEFHWYPACLSEGVEPALMSAAKELVGAKET